VIVTAAPIFLAGADPSLLWSLANLMQMFYYLLFFNIEYPDNLNEFLRMFSWKINILSATSLRSGSNQ